MSYESHSGMNGDPVVKRLFDIGFSMIALTVLLIPFCIIALLVKFDSKGTVIYWSVRVGRDNTNFYMPKFRTMYKDAPEVPTNELDDPDKHITKIGRLLRKYSCDELPQFLSVLSGDMSVVGPRPMIPKVKELIDERTRTGVCSLRPGITGWAQINGRDNLSLKEKLCLETEYLHRQSLWFDLKIILKTIVYVVRARGVWH